MAPRTIGYLTVEGLKGAWRNKLMGLATVGTIILSLLLIGGSMIVSKNINYLLQQIETRFGITAYIDDEIEMTDEEIQDMKQTISNIPYVIGVEYISKEEALESFVSSIEDEEMFTKFKEDNPLPASFEVKVSEVQYQELVVADLGLLGLTDTTFFENETDMFLEISNMTKWATFGIIIVLIVVGILLMSNTIKLTVHMRRKEISIMKYIGAKDYFVKIPFLIEGVTLGTIGSLIPMGLIWIFYEDGVKFLNNILRGVLQGLSFCDINIIMKDYIPVCLIIGIGIGFFGSSNAIRKYLNV